MTKNKILTTSVTQLVAIATFSLISHSATASQVIASDIPMAENALVMNENSIFVSSKEGIYHLKQTNGNWEKNLLTTQLLDGTTTTDCQMGGITQVNDIAYTICSDGFGNPMATSRLLAFDPYRSNPTVMPLGEIDVVAPNGMTADTAGNLYIADTGGYFAFGGSLVKVQLHAQSDVLAQDSSTFSQSVLKNFLLSRPNGLRFQGNRLYLSMIPTSFVAGRSTIDSYRVQPWGLENKRELTSSYAFLDDFSFSTQGLVTTKFLGQQIEQLDMSGNTVASQYVWLPTSVHRYSASDSIEHSQYVVTSQTGNVSIITLS